MLNMFSGGTGDDDEQHIIAVMNCLPLCRIVQILNMADMSIDDFDDEVDGDEWDELLTIFENAVAHCPDGQHQI
jgi:hypothetical protein